MAVAGVCGMRSWVVDVEKKLDEADASVEISRWQRHCIYRVPACIKDLKPNAYRPQLVSLGPFHHGDRDLVPMEEHKRRAMHHLLRRAKRPLEEFATAVEEIAEQLASAYMDLGAEYWRYSEGRERFLEMMIVDGCFLLEVMRVVKQSNTGDYAPNDPIFSHHGVLYMVPYIRRDMLMLENQLPLLLLERLVAVETRKPPNEGVVNLMVLRFLSCFRLPRYSVSLVGLHALDLYRRNMLYSHRRRTPDRGSLVVPATATDEILQSVEELSAVGIRFRKSNWDSLCDIRFQHGVLTMPTLTVDDSTEYAFLNMMAFERLYAGAGNEVTAYVFFMDNIIHSAKDVALLSSAGIIQNAVAGTDKAVAQMFNDISRDIVLEPDSAIDEVHRQVSAYCRKRWRMLRARIVLADTYFKNNPWAFFSLTAAVVVLVATIMQTVYTVLQFYRDS